MKFTKGQAVYHRAGECVIYNEDINTVLCHVLSKDGLERVEKKNLRPLHEPPGFYVPEVGDKRVDGYEFNLNREHWNNTCMNRRPITEDDLRIAAYRFPIPPEALESEKWAREQEALTKEIIETAQESAQQFKEGMQKHLSDEKIEHLKKTRDLVRKSHEELGKTTHINWRPVTERPESGDILIAGLDWIRVLQWCDDDIFAPDEHGWVYCDDLNYPKADPTLELARKLRSCTEEEAVKILKEKGYNE
jgi:hypothetical protein